MKRLLFFFTFLLNHWALYGIANDSIFKEYDIRGIVGEEFEISDTYEIASAVATYFKMHNPDLSFVYVGADGRVHSPAIKKEAVRAFQDLGLDVVDIGTCTTPTLYFALHQTSVPQAGLMITASHNPGNYNGMKICLGYNIIFGDEIKKVRDIYKNKSFAAKDAKPGTATQIDMIKIYTDYLLSLFPHLIGADFKAILDCGNGAAGTVLPLLVKKMQWEGIQLLYPEVDGNYPHHIADPTVEKNMEDLKNLLAKSDACLGLGFDGDCDRMGAMTKCGKLIKGDLLLGIYSKLVLEQYPGSAVVFDVSSSKVLFDVVKQRGGVPAIAQTGVANIKKKMAETGAKVGGEMSCHTVFKDRYYGFDDGVYSMLRFFEVIKSTGKTFEELLAEFPEVYSSPTYRLPCDRSVCLAIIEALKEHLNARSDIEIITVDGLRVHFNYGWAIVRPSNTEPLISIRFEGDSPENLMRIKKEFYTVISEFMDCEEILY
jgi:phosphomannomutase/phosphoglucomutase